MSAGDRLDFLFATWEGGGNIPPTLTAVRALATAGHRVRVLCDRCTAPDIADARGEFVPWRRAPSCRDRSAAAVLLRDWEAATPAESFGCLRDAIMFGPALAYAQDLLEEIRPDRPDLVVGSDMLFGVMAACEADRQPLALLATNLCLYPIEGIPPFGAGLNPAGNEAERQLHTETANASRAMFNAGLPALNDARRALGLRPLADTLDQLDAAERMFLATARAFDFPAARLPENVRYVGPLLGEPHWAMQWRPPWTADDSRPLVLVAFSSTFQNQAAVLQRIVDALAVSPVRAVVTLGPGLTTDGVNTTASNVIVSASAPHDAIMRETAVVVTHAGHGTVMRALAHRVPLLCMPMGRDQNDNTARVVARGAGLRLPPEANADAIASALRRLISESAFARASRRLGDAVAAEARSSPLIEDLVRRAAAHRNGGQRHDHAAA